MSIHHDIFGHRFISVDCSIVENEEIAIWSPTKLCQRVNHLLLLIHWYFAYQIELLVQLDQGFVICGNIEILLRWRERSCGNAVFVLGFYVDFTSLLNSEYAALTIHY